MRLHTPFTRYSRLSNRVDNRFDNRLYRVNGASRRPLDVGQARRVWSSEVPNAPLQTTRDRGRGATTFSKLGVQLLGLCFVQNKIRMIFPVSCTAVCYVTVITLFITNVGVVRPNFGGPDPPRPPVVAPLDRGPCSRVDNAREHGSCVPITRVHGPCWQKALHDNAFCQHGPWTRWSLHTTRANSASYPPRNGK